MALWLLWTRTVKPSAFRAEILTLPSITSEQQSGQKMANRSCCANNFNCQMNRLTLYFCYQLSNGLRLRHQLCLSSLYVWAETNWVCSGIWPPNLHNTKPCQRSLNGSVMHLLVTATVCTPANGLNCSK